MTAPSPSSDQEPLAIIGLILSVLVPPLGLLISIVAIRNIKLSGRAGKNLAILGIVIGGAITTLIVFAEIFATLIEHSNIVTP